LTEDGRRTVCVVLVDRANYGRLKPVMQAIKARPNLRLQVLAAGTMVLERFDQPVRVVRADGFDIDGEIYIELEGSTPATMAKSVGFGMMEFASEFHRLKPDMMLVIGDRYEALAAAVAAAYMNIPIVHVQGGEVSGSIDESARHAITKFSQFHVPSTKRSADYLVRMGERPETIITIGCPSSDIARELDLTLESDVVNKRGAGIDIDVTKPYFLVLFHPTTTEFGVEGEQMSGLLAVLDKIRVQTVLLWPNIDAGADRISKMIRVYRSQHDLPWMRTVTNLTPEEYLRVLANAQCAIGNSSSFVRDAGYFGTPVVLVGRRQQGRETDAHVTRVPTDEDHIREAILNQLEHGRYPPSTLYGDGHVSERVAKALETITLYIQKRLAFVDDES